MDYHRILGVRESASKKEIKKAYYGQAKTWHPDVNPSKEANKKFIELTVAYEALMEGKTSATKTTSSQATYTSPVDSSAKWRNVYTPPTNKQDYKDWVKAAKERAKRNAEKYSQKEYKSMMETIAFWNSIRKYSFLPALIMFVVSALYLVDYFSPSKEIPLNEYHIVDETSVIFNDSITVSCDEFMTMDLSLSPPNMGVLRRSALLGVYREVALIYGEKAKIYPLMTVCFMLAHIPFILLITSGLILFRKKLSPETLGIFMFFVLYFLVVYFST